MAKSEVNGKAGGAATGARCCGCASDGFSRFCQDTSLHGWKYIPKESGLGLMAWVLVMVVSLVSASYMVVVNTIDFYKATVSFGLESPTESLDSIFFPSVVLCNINALSGSFVREVSEDPDLVQWEFTEIFRALDHTLIHGQKTTAEEDEIIEAILGSKTYDQQFEQFLNVTSYDYLPSLDNTRSLWTNVDLFIWHDSIPEGGFDLSKENRHSLKRSMLSEVVTQFKDGQMVPQIKFRGNGLYYETGFSTDISEHCLWMTPYVKKSENPYKLRDNVPSCKMGANNGLQLLLDAEIFDYASSPSSSAQGFTLALLHHLDIPIMKQSGIGVDPGQSLQVAVTPSLITTTDAARQRFAPVDRKCYFEEEVLLRHFPAEEDYRYEISNCLFEATLQEIEHVCGCTLQNFVDVVDGFEACDGQKKECMDELMQDMGDWRNFIDDIDGQAKPCLATCNDQKYHILATQSTFPNKKTFTQTEEFCIVAEKLSRSSCKGAKRTILEKSYPNLCPLVDTFASLEGNSTVACKTLQAFQDRTAPENGDLLSLQQLINAYTRENIAQVTVYIRDPYVAHYLRDEKITEISFVGTVGGLLGLFLGFSFISVVELVYLCLGMTKKDSSRVEVANQSVSLAATMTKVKAYRLEDDA